MGKKQAVKTSHQAPALVKEGLAIQVLCMQQHQAELYEAIMAWGQEEAYSVVKEAISRSLEKGKTVLLKEGYEKGLKEGEEHGRTAEWKTCEMKHRLAARVTTDLSTQTTNTTTANVITPSDRPPCLLNNLGMSTKPPSTCRMAIQASDGFQPIPQLGFEGPVWSQFLSSLRENWG